MKFSVVTSVYKNDKPEFVARALDSITVEQTLGPDEVVLVVDGPVPEALASLLKSREAKSDGLYKLIWLPENKGLGNALRVGVEAASHEIIARMDSDDVSVPDRFEKQIAYMESHPECDLLGGQISEFIDTEDNVVGRREVPCDNGEIHAWMKRRCPFNHMSVAMIRERVLSVGNYIDWHYNEDYYLWVRMALENYRFANLDEVLVNVRVGSEMYARRGGWKYFKSEEGIQRYMLSHKLIGLPRYVYNTLGRFVIQVAMPNSLRGWVFRKLFRK